MPRPTLAPRPPVAPRLNPPAMAAPTPTELATVAPTPTELAMPPWHPAWTRLTLVLAVLIVLGVGLGFAVQAAISGIKSVGARPNQATVENLSGISVQPASVKLICDHADSLDPTSSSCVDTFGVTGIAVEITGISTGDLQTLCNDGYQIEWTDNQGGSDGLSGPGCSYVPAIALYPDSATAQGPWIINWLLKDPSGKTVLSATYSAYIP